MITDASASLLDAGPAVARSLGRGAAAEIGHLRVLPVLAVAEGDEAPRHADPGVIALVVLNGLLVSERRTMAGLGDVIVDLESGWTACTPVRLAIVGAGFSAVAGAWPDAAAGLVARARPRRVELAAGGALDERVLELLWRLASHWGIADGDGAGMTLPLALEVSGLASLTGRDASEVAEALIVLGERDDALRRSDGSWRLTAAEPATHGGHSRARRDELRARSARQLARARQSVDDFVLVSGRADLEVRRSRNRREIASPSGH
jgi:hypothetical protein